MERPANGLLANRWLKLMPLPSANRPMRMAIMKFTAGPAMAMTNSWLGFSGIWASWATPPSGESTICLTGTP